LGYVSGSLQNFSSPSVAENRRVSIYAVEEVVGGDNLLPMHPNKRAQKIATYAGKQ